MPKNIPRRRAPIVTVFRKFTAGQARCWYYDGGQAIEMAPQLAELEARKGLVTLKTLDGERRPG
jgi:hypothetical protein